MKIPSVNALSNQLPQRTAAYEREVEENTLNTCVADMIRQHDGDSLLTYKLYDVASCGLSATLIAQGPSCLSPRWGILREGVERGAAPFLMLTGTSAADATVTASSSKDSASTTLDLALCFFTWKLLIVSTLRRAYDCVE